MAGKLFIISACSGAGKTSLVDEVLGRLAPSCPIARVVTYTSRSIRPGEVAGEHYHFLSPQEFKGMIEAGFFLEWSGEYDHYYGTPRHVLDEVAQGQSRILIINRPGAHNVLQYLQRKPLGEQGIAVPIWIEVPSIQELRRRLEARGEKSIELIERRLQLAQKEMRQESENSLYKHKILNDNFTKAAKELEMLLLQALAKS